eukprot:scaffold102009_cov60-Phaeocystis_antarctica.AAC.3
MSCTHSSSSTPSAMATAVMARARAWQSAAAHSGNICTRRPEAWATLGEELDRKDKNLTSFRSPNLGRSIKRRLKQPGAAGTV